MALRGRLTRLACGLVAAVALGDTALAQTFTEAPSLAKMVADRALPPVKDRLPPAPIMLKPATPGQYGGNLRTVLRGGQDYAWIARTIGYDGLVRWNDSFTDVEPNLAESWQVSPDATVYTIKLRAGVRWSDGHPFTTADIAFWWELFRNDAINPGKDPFFTVGGKLATFEALDALTFRFTFAAPNGRFLQRLANPTMGTMTGFPEHIAAKYYPPRNPQADALAKPLGFDSGYAYLQALFPEIRSRILSAEFPTLHAWKFTAAYNANTTVLTAARNPYYYKVDSAGHQLPYIDTVTFEVGTDLESLLLKAQSGGLDLLSRHINTIDNKSVLFDGQKRGNYSLYTLTSVGANTWALAFNLTGPSDVKRALFAKKDFRIAMSQAIDRRKIIDTVYFGVTKPAQVAVPESFPDLYNKQLATQYLEFDPAKANRLLDGLGLAKRDGDGFRLGPDGQPLIVSVETVATAKEWVDVLELVAENWKAVGIRVKLDILDRALLQSHIDANAYDAVVLWPEGGGGQDLRGLPRWFAPVSIHSGFGPGWYFNGLGDPRGANWKPPQEVQRTLDLYNEMLRTPSPAAQDELMRKLLQQAADNFFAIGIAAPIDGYGIVSNRVHNVPLKGMFDSWDYPQPAPAHPEQFWISP